VGEDSQIFLGLESPGDMDSDFSGEGGGEVVAGVVLWAIREAYGSVGHGVKEYNGNSSQRMPLSNSNGS
jgi:hypothetical protein